jgi:regulatory GntR family protein
MTRWLKKRRLWSRRLRRGPVWSEPALPPYVKINPEGVNPEPGELQPGDISMAKAAEEFLAEDAPGEMNGDLHLRMEDLENAPWSIENRPRHPNSATPLYLQVAALLRARIESGELTSRLPSLKTIAQEYGVSHITTEKAMQVLRDDGLVVTVVGRGTFVAPK